MVFMYILLLFKLGSFSACFTYVLYERNQTIMTYECKTSNILEQVEELKATSAEKDTLIAKFEAIVKKNEG